jgi:MFS family permease
MAISEMPPVHRGLISRRLKSGVFALEALNALGTTYYFYDIYFVMRDKFGFHAVQNLFFAAVIGAISAFSSFFAGRFAQRFGYLTSVQVGTGVMIVSLLIGSQVEGLVGTVTLVLVAAVGLCFTWPALEALMSEGESRLRLQSMVGIYNVTWAGFGAIAYFTGGAMLEKWPKSIFLVPAVILVLEMALAFWLERQAEKEPAPDVGTVRPLLQPMPECPGSVLAPKVFLSMALLANPLAYLANNTLVSTIPTLAKRLHFTPMLAGFVCSIWLFVRAASFVFLRLWPRWHYQFRYLAGAYIAMVVSFGAMLLFESFWTLIVTQVIFGLAVGLIYYSSLFYSMDVGETKGEHGGIHEAAIGAGNALGPGLAAVALVLFPQIPGSGTMAVCVLLLMGLAALLRMRFRARA